MKEFLGSIIGGLSLIWAIYQWIIKRQDEEAAKKQKEIQTAIQYQKDELEKEMRALRKQVQSQEEAFDKLKLTVNSLNIQTKSQGQVFNDTTKRIEKVLDRHEDKLDNFGKVIVKG